MSQHAKEEALRMLMESATPLPPSIEGSCTTSLLPVDAPLRLQAAGPSGSEPGSSAAQPADGIKAGDVLEGSGSRLRDNRKEGQATPGCRSGLRSSKRLRCDANRASAMGDGGMAGNNTDVVMRVDSTPEDVPRPPHDDGEAANCDSVPVAPGAVAHVGHGA